MRTRLIHDAKFFSKGIYTLTNIEIKMDKINNVKK